MGNTERHLTAANRRFLEFLAQGMGVVAAYRKAGYRGDRHAAYQLKSRLANPKSEEQRQQENEAYRKARAELLASAPRPRPDRCEICDALGPVMFEHSHRTGKFRGWTCRRCNTTLGFSGDSPDLLEKLAAYLRRNLVAEQLELPGVEAR